MISLIKYWYHISIDISINIHIHGKHGLNTHHERWCVDIKVQRAKSTPSVWSSRRYYVHLRLMNDASTCVTNALRRRLGQSLMSSLIHWKMNKTNNTKQHITEATHQMTPVQTRSSATPEIAPVGGHYAVQGHSRSVIFEPIESLYATWLSVSN